MNRRTIAALLALTLCVSSQAMSEESGTFAGKDNVDIAYRIFETDHDSDALVILPGRGEPMHKYDELVDDLSELGMSIYVMSHRGQGESGRVDGCKIQYVRSYDDYLHDLELFIQTIVQRKPHARIFLLGHSMGAAIGTLYALRHPDVLSALVLSAPMFDMNTPPFSKKTAYGLSKLMVNLGLGNLKGGKDKLETTSSVARKEMSTRVLKIHSSIASEKISFGWVKASLDAIDVIQSSDLSRLPPVLLLQAGKDLHVPPAGQDAFCLRLQSCSKVMFPDSLHEILMEKDEIRGEALHAISDFLRSL